MTREIVLHCMKSASDDEKELCEECPIYGQIGCDHCFEDVLQYVIAMLEDRQDIIYCKDCNEWHKSKNLASGKGYCSVHRNVTTEDYYCGVAERRD